MTQKLIRARAGELADELIALRRHLHRHPELSFEEHQTAAYLEKILDSWAIRHERVAGTGITGVVEGMKKGKYGVLRSDMDALPMEETGVPAYRSVNPGIMHACGHDVHMACLMGAIRILQENRQQLAGTIRFLFQPGEEQLPGGAIRVLASGLLDQPRPDFILGQHVCPELPAGSFGFKPGLYMASTDEIFIEVKGTGGHGALPHRLIDPVLTASHVIVALQQVISRKIPADVPAVLSFGKFDAPGSTNVIPPKVKLEGTLRTMNEKWRKIAQEEIRRTAGGIASSMGADLECIIVPGYPSLVNDPALTIRVMDFARMYSGNERVTELPVRMTGEDFALYSQRFPAVFYRLGTASETVNKPVHHPAFDVDESSISAGAGMLAFLAASLLLNP